MHKFGKSVLFCSFIFISCIVSSPIISAQEKIIVTIATANWPPFHSEKLKDGGPGTKAIVTAFERAGYPAKVKFYPWARSVRMAENGEVDVLGSDYYNPERQKHFYTGELLFTTYSGFVKMKGRSFPYEVHPEDMNKTYRRLESYRIGVMRDYTNEETFEKAAYLNKQVLSGEHEENNLKKLIAGRIDLAVMDKATFEFHMRIQPELVNYQGKLEFMEPPIARHPNHYLVSRKSKYAEEILRAMNEGIRLIREDGTLDKIMSDISYQTPLK